MNHRNCKMHDHPSGGARNCKLQIVACVAVFFAQRTTMAPPFSFSDIKYWIGSGANRAALVIDWDESSTQPPALAWGYRWNGTAHGSDLLSAVVADDPRLFAKLGG